MPLEQHRIRLVLLAARAQPTINVLHQHVALLEAQGADRARDLRLLDRDQALAHDVKRRVLRI